MNKKTEVLLHLSGWLFFLICAVLFIISGIMSRDIMITAGSVVFFIACIFFLIPLFYELKNLNITIKKK